MKERSRHTAFTLIELLVVIAVIALLMAILVPTLQRVRKQAKALVCQANLRQWGTIWATYTAENGGSLPNYRDRPLETRYDWVWDLGGGWWHWTPSDRKKVLESKWYALTKDIMYCPMATKLANRPPDIGVGGTFLAWGWPDSLSDELYYGHGSYGVNGWGQWWPYPPPGGDPSPGRDPWAKYGWSTTDVKNAAAVPVYLDSALAWAIGGRPPPEYTHTLPPPQFDAVPTLVVPTSSALDPVCINRHDGYVNSLFLDWSVRKVGLKELWTLKWHKEYNTRGPWTQAGHVKPEDWPEWMRRFKDY